MKLFVALLLSSPLLVFGKGHPVKQRQRLNDARKAPKEDSRELQYAPYHPIEQCVRTSSPYPSKDGVTKVDSPYNEKTRCDIFKEAEGHIGDPPLCSEFTANLPYLCPCREDACSSQFCAEDYCALITDDDTCQEPCEDFVNACCEYPKNCCEPPRISKEAICEVLASLDTVSLGSNLECTGDDTFNGVKGSFCPCPAKTERYGFTVEKYCKELTGMRPSYDCHMDCETFVNECCDVPE